MKAAMNLLGLPTLSQGGAGMQAGLEASLLTTHGIDLKVLAEPRVASELSSISVQAVAANGPGRRPAVASLLRLATPFGYRSGAAPAGALADRDVVHYPLGFMAAPRVRAATVVTAVDLQHLYYPDFFPRRERLIRVRTWHPAIRRATRVAVCSEVVRRSISDRLGVDRGKIDVIGACCDQRFYRAAAEPSTRGRYLLYPASPRPNKNHARLLRAFKEAKQSHRDLTLILVGPLTHDWSPVESMRIELGLEESVEIRGHVSTAELVELYRGAMALVFPSVFEGFGVPLLEAMATRCPLLVAEIPTAREICGDDGRFFDPEDVAAIRDGIRDIADADQHDLDTMVNRAASRAEAFKSEHHLRLLVNCLKRAVDEKGPM